MTNFQLQDQILKAIYRKIGHLKNKSAFLGEIEISFNHIERDTFYNTVIKMAEEKILFDQGLGYVSFTPSGWDRVEMLMKPPNNTINQNIINADNVINSPIQQGVNSNQSQVANYKHHTNDELQKLVDLMNKHLPDLILSQDDTRKVKAQIVTIQSQLMDIPNPTIINEAGKTIKNITEGAIGSLLATAAQPGVWAVIHALLNSF